MKITIKNTEYTLKYTLRAMIIFEKVTKKAFSITTFTDQLVFFYSLLLANNPDMTLSMDDLITECDANPLLLSEYLTFLQNQSDKEKLFGGNDSGEDKKKE